MRSEWIETTIGAQATLQRGIDITKAEQRPGKVPVVSSSGVSSYHDTAMVKGPGVVLGRKGVVGSVYFINEDYWPHDTSLWVKDFHGNDPRFVYYFFRSIAPKLASLDVGSANPTLNRNHVHPISVVWPSVGLQREISRLLSLLDERIDLLRQTNITLELIAQALFKSWFIDFDPVRAKVEGREPVGMNAEIAALFPDSFEDSALGAIPKGWSAGYFGNIFRESSQRVGDAEAIVLSAVQSGELVPSAQKFTKKVHSNDISKYKRVSPFSFAYNPSRINIGSIGINEEDTLGAVSPIYVVCETECRASAYFMWHQLRLPSVKKWIATLSSGTVRQSLAFKDFCSIPLTYPPYIVMNAFLTQRENLYGYMRASRERIDVLEAVRDTLLPRLISGELRLPEAEVQVDEALA